jgi:hypothetical protein
VLISFKGIPFIGSANELKRAPEGYFWFQFTEWGRKYGSIYQYIAYGNVNVVVGTEKIANDLLRERGDIYSSRQQLPMGSQLMSDNKRALLLPYGGMLTMLPDAFVSYSNTDLRR